eukprot:Skav227677  [mRNA]  locus=scaffold2108:24912:25913:- [translate_table: standard]
MAKVIKEAYQELQQLPLYRDGMASHGVSAPPITWADDIAVPVASSRAADLQEVVEQSVQIIHTCFMKHGLTPNFRPGKTEVIMMHRGPHSDRFRARLFDGETIPVLVTSSENYVLSVRVVSSYKHLGARQGMNADIDQKIKARLGQARQAFEEMRKPIFAGSRLPGEVKLRLFQNLILSKVLSGCNVWAHILAAIVRKLESSIVGYYRRIVNDGWWNAACSTTHDFLVRNQLPNFRIFLAKHRPLYLRHLALRRKLLHWRLLIIEESFGSGWLCEVREGLRWMAQMITLPFDCQTEPFDWEYILHATAGCKPWKGWVRRATNRHVLQENIEIQ